MRVYDEVWAVARNIIKKTSLYHDRRNRWWEQPQNVWEDKLSHGQQQADTFKPFLLKCVDHSGYTCACCDWMRKCSGCVLPPTEEPIDDYFRRGVYIAIEWHSSLIEEDYNEQVNDVIQHASTHDRLI
jgi:hypothetical protein